MVSPLHIRISGRTGTLSATQNATPAVIRSSHGEDTLSELPCLYLQQRYYSEDNATITLTKAQITA